MERTGLSKNTGCKLLMFIASRLNIPDLRRHGEKGRPPRGSNAVSCRSLSDVRGTMVAWINSHLSKRQRRVFSPFLLLLLPPPLPLPLSLSPSSSLSPPKVAMPLRAKRWRVQAATDRNGFWAASVTTRIMKCRKTLMPYHDANFRLRSLALGKY